MKSYAPIVLFVYNRPLHTKRTLDALAMNKEAKESELYIFCDGPKPGISETAEKLVQELRSIVRSETRFKNVLITEYETNKGLAKSVVQGVSFVLNQYESVIVLEDDLVVAENFLAYMNSALDKYKENSQVACISGYVYPLRKKFAEAFFIRGADCWGWATWKDKWSLYSQDAVWLQQQIKDQKSEAAFDFNKSYPYMQMLADRILGKNQSWAVLWYASAFIKNKLCLYPPVSLVRNIGNDGSGTHFKVANDTYSVNFELEKDLAFPEKVSENTTARKEFEKFFNTMKQPLMSRITNKLKVSFRTFLGKKSTRDFFGNYKSWSDALIKTSGYDNQTILTKVSNSIQKVKNGEAAYERDSVAFSEYSYSEDIRSAITEALPVEGGSIVDFGGSLGSLYFQYKRFIDEKSFTWTVVEQSHFVEYGKKNLQDEELKFAVDLSEACLIRKPNLLIAASVLCYLEKPYEWMNKFIATGADYILIDRTGFIEGNEERITMQTVPEEIYKASYPAWFLNERKFVETFKDKYEIIREFMSEITDSVFLEDNKKVYWKGFVLKRVIND